MADREILKSLALIDKEALKILYAYAYHHCYGNPYIGKEPEDFVQEAFCQLAIGQRNWNCEKYPDIIPVIKGIIRSLISNEMERNSISQGDGRIPRKVEVDDFDEFVSLKENSPDDHVIYSELMESIEKLVEGDEDMELVYLAILEGYEGPKQIALKIGKSEKEVNNILRRIHYRHKKQLEKEGL